MRRQGKNAQKTGFFREKHFWLFFERELNNPGWVDNQSINGQFPTNLCSAETVGKPSNKADPKTTRKLLQNRLEWETVVA